ACTPLPGAVEDPRRSSLLGREDAAGLTGSSFRLGTLTPESRDFLLLYAYISAALRWAYLVPPVSHPLCVSRAGPAQREAPMVGLLRVGAACPRRLCGRGSCAESVERDRFFPELAARAVAGRCRLLGGVGRAVVFAVDAARPVDECADIRPVG